MQAWKGHRNLLRALAKMRHSPAWTCWIAGGAQRSEELAYERALHSEAHALGISSRVRFLGQRSDVADLLRAADVFCQPNEQPEPFGLSLVEALGAGLPVVTTAKGGAMEIVDSSCGLLVDQDPSRVAEALLSLIEAPERRSALARSAPARARSLCDASSQMAALAAVLESAFRGGGEH
jgi:glycosyltransferase involved in cell wall biosynthesis